MRITENDMYLDKEGVFHRPTLQVWNKKIKHSSWHNKENIDNIKRETISKVKRLQKEIEEIKEIAKENIEKEKAITVVKKTPLTQYEYDEQAKETEERLREWRKECLEQEKERKELQGRN